MKTRILILGGGFAGLYTAFELERTLARRTDFEVTLVNDQNFMLFTPMLHEVVGGDIDPTDIVSPLRKLLRHVTFYESSVESIDLERKQVTIAHSLGGTRELQFDHLVISLGSETRFFDEETKVYSLRMKTLADALLLRNHLIALLEMASVETDPTIRQRLLTFVVAGGGFAGVETVGAMNDFLREVLKYYPTMDPSWLKVAVIHPGDSLLPEFGGLLGSYTTDCLRKGGVEVLLKTKVSRFDGQTVYLTNGEKLYAATLVWTAGVTPSPILGSLPLKTEKGRIVVAPTLESEIPDVWVVGDCAHIPNIEDGNKPFPPTAQHAMREGRTVARNIGAAVLGGTVQPFRYKTLGQLAAIGRRRGVASILGFHFSGFLAWILWRGTYLLKLPRLEKKIRVAVAWALDLLFSKDLVQVIGDKELRRFAEVETIRQELELRLKAGPPRTHSEETVSF